MSLQTRPAPARPTPPRFRASSAAWLLPVVGWLACSSAPPPPEAAGGAVAAVPAAPARAGEAAPAPGTASPSSPAGTGGAAGRVITAPVEETMNSGGYTYVRLRDGGRDVWLATTEFPVKSGDRITATLTMAMENFHSKTLDRDFPLIYFVPDVAREGGTGGAAPGAARAPAALVAPEVMSSHATAAAPQVPQLAPPPGGLSIADVWARRAALSGKTVVVRGTVVKANTGIMDRNWFHVQDGSGSAAAKTDDLTVTTTDQAKPGDVVTVSGVLGTGKDFGAGYAYDAILENATLTAK